MDLAVMEVLQARTLQVPRVVQVEQVLLLVYRELPTAEEMVALHKAMKEQVVVVVVMA
jgi:hypothetical protein